MDMRISSTAQTTGPLTRTANYALRALLLLARRGVGKPLPASRIAELTGTPSNYLGKTLGALARIGLVQSTHGPAGGFALAVSPETVTIADIADAFAENAGVPPCLLRGGNCRPDKPCSAHHRWQEVMTSVRKPLLETTLTDLIGGASTLEPHDAVQPPALPTERNISWRA
jgi:Rrf2 family protein